jgi:hypothetical protein
MAMRPSNDGSHVCQRCHKENNGKFGASNDMDPGDDPPGLEPMFEAEQALIAQAHQHIQVHRCTGGGLKYRGHVCFFPQLVRTTVET